MIAELEGTWGIDTILWLVYHKISSCQKLDHINNMSFTFNKDKTH